MYDRARFEQVMKNEADMAYKRRAGIFLEMLDIQPGENVFECGCGLGFNLLLLQELGACRVTGLDIDLPRLRRAQGELRHSAVRILAGDVYALPFKNEEFDKILLPEVLEHLDDDVLALTELKRVLRPGGILVITVPHSNYPFLWDPINKTLEFLNHAPVTKGPFAGIWTNHVRLYHPDFLRHVVELAGFVVSQIRLETHYSFPFAHQLVYGIGKPLVENGVCANADRFRFALDNAGRPSLIRLGLAMFNSIDRLNDKVSGKETYVSLILKAVKQQ